MKYRIWNKVDKRYVPIFDKNGYDSLGYNRNKGQVDEMFLTDGETVFVLVPTSIKNYKPEIYRDANQSKFIIEQFTGFKDRIGSKIYVGDILELNDPIHETAKVIYKGDYHAIFELISLEDRPHVDRGCDIGSKKGKRAVCELARVENEKYLPIIIGNVHEYEERR